MVSVSCGQRVMPILAVDGLPFNTRSIRFAPLLDFTSGLDRQLL